MEVHVDASHVTVHSEGQTIARHERSYLVKQELLALEHYLGVLEHKPGALAHSKALVQYRISGLWPEHSFDAFSEKLMERQGRGEGTRAMIRLLQLIPVHGHRQNSAAAIEGALACGSGDPATVLHLLKPDLRSEHHAAPLLGTGVGYERPLPRLDVYDQLLSNKPQTEVRVNEDRFRSFAARSDPAVLQATACAHDGSAVSALGGDRREPTAIALGLSGGIARRGNGRSASRTPFNGVSKKRTCQR